MRCVAFGHLKHVLLCVTTRVRSVLLCSTRRSQRGLLLGNTRSAGRVGLPREALHCVAAPEVRYVLCSLGTARPEIKFIQLSKKSADVK